MRDKRTVKYNNNTRAEKLRKKLRSDIIDNQAKEITLGKYYQQDNEKEPLVWLVLKVEGDKALLLTKFCIDCIRYNNEYERVTWAESSVRYWLNKEFYFSALNVTERKLVCENTVDISTNQEYSTNTLHRTIDRVFLLSIEDAMTYFSSDTDRKAGATPYAKSRGVSTDSDNNAWWWLRTPGVRTDHACHVFKNGSIHFAGHNVDMDVDALRPAVWITLN